MKGYLCILLTMITLNAESIKHFVNTGSIYGSVQYDWKGLYFENSNEGVYGSGVGLGVGILKEGYRINMAGSYLPSLEDSSGLIKYDVSAKQITIGADIVSDRAVSGAIVNRPFFGARVGVLTLDGSSSESGATYGVTLGSMSDPKSTLGLEWHVTYDWTSVAGVDNLLAFGLAVNYKLN